MRSEQSFRKEQRGVALRMGAAMATTVLVLSVTVPASLFGPIATSVERLRWLAQAETVVALWLVAAIANVARLRFFSSQDIAGSGTGDASPSVRNAGANLQNTLEQAVLAGMGHAAVALTWPRPLPLLIASVCLFSTGRALFWRGCARGAAHRALGFALTFYPSAATLLMTAFLLLAQAINPP